MDGLILRAFIENQKRPKLHIAKDLGMSKQNLYQLFDSKNLEEETIKNIERVFKTKWGQIKASVNIDSNIAIRENKPKGSPAMALECPPDSNRLIELNASLARSNEVLARLLEKRLENPDVDAGWDNFRLIAMDYLFEVAAGKRYKDIEDARNMFRKKLSDGIRAKMKKGNRV